MVSEVEDWLAEAEKYLNYLKMELPSFNALQHMQLRIEWEKKIAAIRTSLGTLQRQYNEQLQLLQSGQQLDSLPPVTPPALPPVPTVEMKIHAMMQPQHPTVAMGVKPPPHVQPQAPAATPSLFSTAIPFAVPQQPLAGAQRVPQPAPGPANTPNPTSQPAGKLEQLLEKLRARFPQCNRSQLTAVLQQIKMSRGTMAGLSMEELTQQVAQRLAQSETPRQSHGPIGPPSATARTFPSSAPQAHVTAHLPHRSPAPQAIFNTRPPVAARPSSRKLCLVCQNQVEPGTQQVLSCTHVVHKELLR
nr:PREDICTED: RING finger protein 214 [Lepisosteus oculatus]